MNNCYIYQGIGIAPVLNELPISFIATFENAKLKATFNMCKGKIKKVFYTEIENKFPEPKLKELKIFVKKENIQLVHSLTEYLVYGFDVDECITLPNYPATTT